jgi:hypothetical protein
MQLNSRNELNVRRSGDAALTSVADEGAQDDEQAWMPASDPLKHAVSADGFFL